MTVKPAKLVLLTDTLVALYRQMLRIRRCEERLVKSFYEGLIPGQFFSSMGQEAVAVGVCHHLRADDVVFSTHRGQGHAIAKGVEPVRLFAELYGRASGASAGRAGAHFVWDPEHGLLGTSGILGASILQAVGAAHAFQMAGSDRVAVALFGDGAANCGAFHEGLNLASLWKLPVLFICENNRYAGRVGGARVAANTHFSQRAKLYDMPGVEVDGNDVAAVYAAAFEGLRRAREGKGPMLLECNTLRMRPHAEGDIVTAAPSAAELDECRQRDPLPQLANQLLHGQAITSYQLASMAEEVQREVEQAHQAAVNSPWPKPAAHLGSTHRGSNLYARDNLFGSNS
jgi:2-oxoisovalerate dehydrogenase E1 component